MRRKPSLIIVAPVVAGLSVIGAALSVVARWPHQFGGHGDRDHMLADFASSGTALAPPLAFLVLLVVASLVIRRHGVWGTVACFVLVALSALMIVASLGEAFAGRTPDVPHAVQVFSGVWGTVAGGLLEVLSIRSIVKRRRIREAHEDHAVVRGGQK